ncbi:MAG: response regulator [bacterium]|nr:response regulator [bacterium]
MQSAQILIADDDGDILEMYRDMLSSQNWNLQFVQDGSEALALLAGGKFDLALLDLYMPGLSGLEVLEDLRKKKVETHIFLITGFGTREGTLQKAVKAMKIGATDILEKPFNKRGLLSAIQGVLNRISEPSNVLSERLDAYVKAHACDSSLTVSNLSAHFRISSRYVARLFREHLGQTFRQQLSRYRVEAAKHLIEKTDAPLYSIAEKCGFKGYRQLTAAFRRIEGIPPRKYRELYADRHTQRRHISPPQ